MLADEGDVQPDFGSKLLLQPLPVEFRLPIGDQ